MKNTKHYLSFTKEYKLWGNIKNRCYNKQTPVYFYYGHRGIKMYDDWINNPPLFIEYVKSLSDYGTENYTLDRINNDGNYEPGNLRWIDKTTQVFNRRKAKNKSSKYVGITYNKATKRWKINLMKNYKPIYIPECNCETKAALVRDKYIKDNNLKNKLNFNE